MGKKKPRSVQYALRWRLVGNRWRLVCNRWRLVCNRWRLVGSHQTSESGCHSKTKGGGGGECPSGTPCSLLSLSHRSAIMRVAGIVLAGTSGTGDRPQLCSNKSDDPDHDPVPQREGRVQGGPEGVESASEESGTSTGDGMGNTGQYHA